MTQEQQDLLNQALRLVDDTQMQCNRLLRRARYFAVEPQALTKSDLLFEIKVLKTMLGSK